MNKTLKIFSGICCLCDIGEPTGRFDSFGREIHTGDVVLLNHILYRDTDCETLDCRGLTAVVRQQYQSFSDGSVKLVDDKNYFVMGIKSCGFDDPDWQFYIVKKYSNVIEGEHWKDYGFNYQYSEKADESKIVS